MVIIMGHTSNAATAAEWIPQVFDPNNYDPCGDYQPPNPILKKYIDQAKPFPYGEEQVQSLINFANEASIMIAGVGGMIEGMIRERGSFEQELRMSGHSTAADNLSGVGIKLIRMNEDLKVLCLSVNCMAAALIETAKKVDSFD